MKIMSANRITPNGTPRFVASHLGLYCLPMSHKKDARLICFNFSTFHLLFAVGVRLQFVTVVFPCLLTYSAYIMYSVI